MFVVLHGQTEWNREHKLQGRRDSPLTVLGEQQSRRAADILASYLNGPARIVASPLGRTQATARLVAERLEIAHFATDDRLAEVALGAFEGLTRDQIRECWPSIMDGPTRNDWFFRAPGGETYDSVAVRLGSWLAEQKPDTGLIVVSHGIASRVLRGLYARLPREVAVDLEVVRDAPFRLWDGRQELLEPP